MLENYLGCFLLLAEWLQKTRYSSNDQLNPETLAQVEDLIKRFDVDLSGRIEFGNGEFLGVIASIAVTSVQDIDDFVFSAAFRTFDHDADGLITPLEMHIVTSLFLPMETEAEDHFVEELIQKMDTNVDGKIDYQEFVDFVRNCGSADILSAQNSRSSGNSSP